MAKKKRIKQEKKVCTYTGCTKEAWTFDADNCQNHTTDCGMPFEHAWHLYMTLRGAIKACDGAFGKRV